MGGVHIDDGMVSEAVAVDTLFIHGSRVEGGSVESLKSVKSSRRRLRSNEEELERPHGKRSRELGSSSKSKSSSKSSSKSWRKWKSEWSRTDDDDDGDDDGDEDG